MKDPEEAIERVFAGMRDTEAPAGMQGRILTAMEEQASRKEVPGPWRKWAVVLSLTRPVGLGAAAAGVLMLAFLLVSMRKPGHDARGAVAAGASGSIFGAEKAVPQHLEPQASSNGYDTPKAVTLDKAELLRPMTKKIQTAAYSAAWESSSETVKATDETTDFDALAISEMLAPSKPAPPLPLTHQEKLLAQIVHKGDPEQLADLKSDLRAQRVELARTEFHDFFEPPQPAKVSE